MPTQPKPTKPRNSIRYSKRTYNETGYYFVTVCTFQRHNRFIDPIIKATMSDTWLRIPQQKYGSGIELDEFVVMPNHIHGILSIINGSHGGLLRPFPDPNLNKIGKVVGTYKGLTTKQIKALHGAQDTNMRIWQRGYYDRIIRNETELNRIRYYIQENPRRWAEDRENLDHLLQKMTYRTTP